MNDNNLNKKMSDYENNYNIIPNLTKQEYISTSYIELDKILNGGIPKGYITEIHGTSAVGKTTLALKIITEAQKHNLLTFYKGGHNG